MTSEKPGQYPFTRGIHATGYQGKLWTMRMFAGFGTAEQTNERFRFLLSQGQTGLSTAFDMPTLMGYDSDSPLALGEVGVGGVAIDTLEDFRVLFKDIPLDAVSVSMTINGPAIVALAYLIAVADERGIPRNKINGTLQNDPLKEFIAQHEWVVPPKPSVRIVTDMIAFCTEALPKWNTVSISGYHIREAGSSAVQELAFTLADGLGYVQACVERGMDVDSFAPRLSFFFDVHNNFFEEIAKFRAARRMWAKFMKERFGAKNERSMLMRTHAQTAGVTLTAQQPYNNVVRVALQALAAVLGGTQSLHTNSLDETYALPTEEAVTLALRTQQIIADETGVTRAVDPLGGSHYLEALTDQMEREATQLIEKIDALGGIVSAVEKGFPQGEVAHSAMQTQHRIERGEEVVVGVNKYVNDQPSPIPTLKIDANVERRQLERLARVKKRRDANVAMQSLDAIRKAASSDQNLMPHVIAAAKADCTIQEICDAFREVYGAYREVA